MAIVSASGYPQYSGSLINPVISTRILERVYETSIAMAMSDTSWFGEIRNVGDQVTFFRSPSAYVRRSTKGGQIVHDTLSTSPITITIDHALEASLKVDPLDKRMIAQWSNLEAKYCEDLARQIERVIDDHFLNSLYVGNSIAPENRGPNAGVISRNINLGAPGAPIILTAGNVVDFLLQLELVFRERSVDIYRDTPILAAPPIFNTLLMGSELRNALMSGLGKATVLMNGRVTDQKMAGFDVLLSNNVPRVWDNTVGKWCYHLISLLKKANALAFYPAQSREIEDVNDWMKYTQSRYVYGFGTIYPEFMVDAYVTFTP